MKYANKLFYNSNGNTYYVLFGNIGQKSLLCNIDYEQYVICKLLEKNHWWHGQYFCSFDEAYNAWKGK